MYEPDIADIFMDTNFALYLISHNDLLYLVAYAFITFIFVMISEFHIYLCLTIAERESVGREEMFGHAYASCNMSVIMST